MDEIKAKDLKENLAGKTINGWKIDKYIDHGKSAAVFKAHNGIGFAALKIFDDELIKKYGDETQFARIERELELIGKHHDNLVDIIDGGFDDITKNHFIVMEFVEGDNLTKTLLNIPPENIGPLIYQLASASRFLEENGYCHRDIKPANIIVSANFQNLKLLDLGVLRPLKGSTLTDGDDLKQFVGTLQYSSPEYLLRENEETVEAWRALTLYQIGGVLHDLIMQKPLFSDTSEPYAVLVNAVQHEQPKIQNSKVQPELLELAGSCLVKDWKLRGKLVSWKSFDAWDGSGATTTSPKQRVTNRVELSRALKQQKASLPLISPEGVTAQHLLKNIFEAVQASVKNISRDNDAIPPAKVSRLPDHENCLRAVFKKSEDMDWANNITFLFYPEILELTSNALQIFGAVHEGASQLMEKEAIKGNLFGGVFNTTAIQSAVEDFVYEAIDRIQKEPLNSQQRWLSYPVVEA